MVAEELAYRGFSCPQVGLDKEFLDVVVTEHARQTVQRFTERYNGRIDYQGAGLKSVLSSWLQRDDCFETVWSSAFGEVYSAVVRDAKDDVERRAGVLAMRLHECGQDGEWQLRLSKPIRFRFDRWLLPLANAVEVSATPKAVSINLCIANVWHKTIFQRTGSNWVTTMDAETLPVFTLPGIRWTILTADALAPSSVSLLKTEVFDYSDLDVREQSDLLLRTCDRAVSIIARNASIYVPWIGNVLRELIPLRARHGVFNSASIDLSPGVICVSDQERPLSLTEALVHEATHQYFHIAKTLGRLDTGKDQTLYFSPFRNTGRPIYNILLAYHAFANVLLFYRTSLDNGSSDDEIAVMAKGRVSELEQQLKPLDDALGSTTALTDLGRALWEPLRECIHV